MVTFATNTVNDAGSHGIHVMDIGDTPIPLDGGIWTFTDNEINRAGGHGILVERFFDGEATLTFMGNTANGQ